MKKNVSHVAYSDESSYNIGRFRSISLISLKSSLEDEIIQKLDTIIDESGLSEFKWSKLRQAREHFAAEKIINYVFQLALDEKIRIDTLIWDIEDSRHKIQGRDDIANLQRMYYHLFRSVLTYRWATGSNWALYPDQQSALNWNTIADYLDITGTNIKLEGSLFETFKLRLSQDFQIETIAETKSTDNSLIQVADLFAGLGAYSHAEYQKYEEWRKLENRQLTLELDFGQSGPSIKLSNRDKVRCKIINQLNMLCKQHKLSIGLSSTRGFKSYKPQYPMNFWVYEPQHLNDKAPTGK